jgi:hypothetical protein
LRAETAGQDPFAYYFCKKKGCGCKTMCYGFGAMSRKCIFCGCSPLMHFSKFNKEIINPINRVGYVGARAAASDRPPRHPHKHNVCGCGGR